MKKKEDIAKIEKLTKDLEDWKSKYLRALADYQNLEKRIAKERIDDARHAAKVVITKILQVLDVLEAAQKVLNDQGLELALKQFKEVLSSEKVEKIDVVGKKFEPHTMECVEVVETDKEDEVIEEVRAGYTLAGEVIRVAKVKVGKRKVDKALDSETHSTSSVQASSE